jgi:glycosyltransferase involved in cell wall biosynthesis
MRVSVVIPLFEQARYVGEAIESVLAQTRPVFELIVVDDGSSDGGADVAAAYGSNVHVVRRPHSGIGATRNHGARLATGDLLSFLDADDVLPIDRFERQVGYLETFPEVDGVFGAVDEFADGERVAGERLMRAPRAAQVARLPSTMLLRRSAFDRVGPYDENLKRSEGIEWLARSDDAGVVLRPVDAVVLHRRLHGKNNGMRELDSLGEYARTLKAVLDRRRAT